MAFCGLNYNQIILIFYWNVRASLEPEVATICIQTMLRYVLNISECSWQIIECHWPIANEFIDYSTSDPFRNLKKYISCKHETRTEPNKQNFVYQTQTRLKTSHRPVPDSNPTHLNPKYKKKVLMQLWKIIFYL